MYFKQKQRMRMHSAIAKATIVFAITLPMLTINASTFYSKASVASAEDQNNITDKSTSISDVISSDIEKELALKNAENVKRNVKTEMTVTRTEIQAEPTYYEIQTQESYIEEPEEQIVTMSTETYEPVAYSDTTPTPSYSGGCLTPSAGVFNGPSGKETYYNLPMDGVVNIMRNAGFSEEEYPYWVRDDGVKMLGPYVMVAADLSIRPRGSLIESSLGTAIVCDTGGFAASNPTQLDIAVTW